MEKLAYKKGFGISAVISMMATFPRIFRINPEDASYILRHLIYQGLHNIKTRYELLADKTIVIENNNNSFRVKIPLLNK